MEVMTFLTRSTFEPTSTYVLTLVLHKINVIVCAFGADVRIWHNVSAFIMSFFTKSPGQSNGSGPVEQRSDKQIGVPRQSINILSQTQT